MSENTEGYKTHRCLIIKPIAKRFGVKKDENTEGYYALTASTIHVKLQAVVM